MNNAVPHSFSISRCHDANETKPKASDSRRDPYGHATAEAECSFHITALLILPYTARCWVELPYWQMEVVSTMSD